LRRPPRKLIPLLRHEPTVERRIRDYRPEPSWYFSRHEKAPTFDGQTAETSGEIFWLN
jgi:hypothetical protein